MFVATKGEKDDFFPQMSLGLGVQADLLVVRVEGESVVARLDHLVSNFGFRA